MKHLSFAVSVVALTWGCDGGSGSTSPRSPSTPTAPAATRALYTLSGVVSEVTPAGPAPVEGAQVQVSNVRRFVATDKNGSYWIAGVYAGITSVGVSAAGYETVNKDVTIDGDTRLDIQVVRRATYTLSGVVSEVTAAGPMPVEGVWVSESYFHAGVWTDTDGFYLFSGPYGTGLTNTISFSKEGYEPEIRHVAIDGNTRLDIQLARRN